MNDEMSQTEINIRSCSRPGVMTIPEIENMVGFLEEKVKTLPKFEEHLAVYRKVLAERLERGG